MTGSYNGIHQLSSDKFNDFAFDNNTKNNIPYTKYNDQRPTKFSFVRYVETIVIICFKIIFCMYVQKSTT